MATVKSHFIEVGKSGVQGQGPAAIATTAHQDMQSRVLALQHGEVMTKVLKTLLAIITSICLFSQTSNAALNRVGNPYAPPTAIRFLPGHNCWKYIGKESIFSGLFAVNQRLMIQSFGESHGIDQRIGQESIELEKRDISLLSNEQSEVQSIGDDTYIIPKSGKYDITFWPHAIQGYDGEIVVCRK